MTIGGYSLDGGGEGLGGGRLKAAFQHQLIDQLIGHNKQPVSIRCAWNHRRRPTSAISCRQGATGKPPVERAAVARNNPVGLMPLLESSGW